jgi:hypothetical protein
MTRERAPIEREPPICQTCGDVARRMVVLAAEETSELARCVDEAGRELTVDTGIVGRVIPGEALLVHAGSALVRHAGSALLRDGAAGT